MTHEVETRKARKHFPPSLYIVCVRRKKLAFVPSPHHTMFLPGCSHVSSASHSLCSSFSTTGLPSCVFSGEVVFNWPSDSHPLKGSTEDPSGVFFITGAKSRTSSTSKFFFCPELSKLGDTVKLSGGRLKRAMIQSNNPTHFS